jgi:hypothetical protein
MSLKPKAPKDGPSELDRLKIENAALLKAVQAFSSLSPERAKDPIGWLTRKVDHARNLLRAAAKQRRKFQEPEDLIERKAQVIQQMLTWRDKPSSPIVIQRMGLRVYEAWVEGEEKTIGYVEGTSAKEAIMKLYDLVRASV